MRKIFLPIASLLLFLFPCLTAAQDTGTGMDFLNIGPTPRVLSVSEAVTSRPSGVASIYSNPSLLARETRSVVDVAYTDRKSTRLNSSHVAISYPVFCFKEKNK